MPQCEQCVHSRDRSRMLSIPSAIGYTCTRVWVRAWIYVSSSLLCCLHVHAVTAFCCCYVAWHRRAGTRAQSLRSHVNFTTESLCSDDTAGHCSGGAGGWRQRCLVWIHRVHAEHRTAKAEVDGARARPRRRASEAPARRCYGHAVGEWVSGTAQATQGKPTYALSGTLAQEHIAVSHAVSESDALRSTTGPIGTVCLCAVGASEYVFEAMVLARYALIASAIYGVHAPA